MMVTTQQRLTPSLSGIENKSSLDVDLDSVERKRILEIRSKTLSPCAISRKIHLRPVTSPKLQNPSIDSRGIHLSPLKQEAHPNSTRAHNYHSNCSDCDSSSSACSSCYYCSSSQSHSSSSSCGCSETDDDEQCVSQFRSLTSRSNSDNKYTLRSGSLRKGLQQRKKKGLRIRFDIDEGFGPSSTSNSCSSPSSSSSAECNKSGLLKSGSKSLNDHAVNSESSRPLKPGKGSLGSGSVKRTLTFTGSTSSRGNAGSASCDNIIAAGGPCKWETVYETLKSKPKRSQSIKKLLRKSKSFIFNSNSNNNSLIKPNVKGGKGKRSFPAFSQHQSSSSRCTEEESGESTPQWARPPFMFALEDWKSSVQTLPKKKSSPTCQHCGATSLPDFDPSSIPAVKGRRFDAKNKEFTLKPFHKAHFPINNRPLYLPNSESKTTEFPENKRVSQKGSTQRLSFVQNGNSKDKEQFQGLEGGARSHPSSKNSSITTKQKPAYHNKSSKKNKEECSAERIDTFHKNNLTMGNYEQFSPTSDRISERVEYLDRDDYHSYYDCRIPRPKLRFVVPTHSYGMGTKSLGNSGRKVDIVDASEFTEISLSDNENDFEDTAYGSGSGSSSKVSSKRRSANSIDLTFSEFEKEQEVSAFNVANSRRFLTFKKSLWRSEHSLLLKRKNDEKIIDFLKSLPLFKKLGSGFLSKLCGYISEINYDCGQYIIRQGSRGDGLYILMSGTAKGTFLSSLDREEIYLRTYHPGDVFGEKSLHGNKLNMMNVRTTDESAVGLHISEEGYHLLMGKSAEFRNRFGQKIPTSCLNAQFERIELQDLRLISTLGVGGFGRVELVTLVRDQSKSYALKQMKKCQIAATRQIEHIKSEKEILMEANCEFIIKTYKTFKDSKCLYMLMECCLGGELWTILRDRGYFNDHTARFYVGNVLEALKYLHGKNIIYRDLKPENLLLDSHGYLKLVDFGFAKRLDGNKTWTFCGTPEYVAPEVILNKGHGITADYWSLGVFMFELLTGTPPFVGGDPMKTYKLILNGIDYVEFPENVSKQAYLLIKKLCRENPEERLGYHRGLSEIKRHKWFDGLDWAALKSKSLTPPIIPCVKGPLDAGNFDDYPADQSGLPPDDLSGWDFDF